MTDRRIDEQLKTATALLQEGGHASPSLDAAVLLCHVLDKPRSYLLTWPERELDAQQQAYFDALLARRMAGEPVAYIIGEREFWSMSFKVSTATLIPRPDTERLVEIALEKAQDSQGAILDLGTGTGAIAIALASELPTRQVIGVDLMAQARELATENATRLAVTNVTFRHGSWFDPIAEDERFALIVSNPPYIDPLDPHLSQGDVRFEPRSALVADEHGLADIRYIAKHAQVYLEQNGWLAFEHGYDQGQAVRDILSQLGYQQVSTEQDYAGNDRVTLGCYSGRSHTK